MSGYSVQSPTQPPVTPPPAPGRGGLIVRLVLYIVLTMIGAYAAFRDPLVRATEYNRYAAMALCALGALMVGVALIRLALGGSTDRT